MKNKKYLFKRKAGYRSLEKDWNKHKNKDAWYHYAKGDLYFLQWTIDEEYNGLTPEGYRLYKLYQAHILYAHYLENGDHRIEENLGDFQKQSKNIEIYSNISKTKLKKEWLEDWAEWYKDDSEEDIAESIKDLKLLKEMINYIKLNKK